MLRFVSWAEDTKGHEVMSVPVGSGWRVGLIILEPFVGGWEQQIFIGRFRRKDAPDA